MASGFLYNLLLIYDVLLIFLRVSKKHITILFIDFQWEIFVGAFIYAVISISSHTAREVIWVDLLHVHNLLLQEFWCLRVQGNFTRLLVKKAEPFIGEDMLLQKKVRRMGYLSSSAVSPLCAFHSTLAESFHTTTAASNDHYNLWIIFI